MKIVRAISMVLVLSWASLLQAQSFTTDVAAYLATHLKVAYTAVPDDMKCRENAPAPGSTKLFFNCQESRKNGVWIGVGWKERSMTREDLHRSFAGMNRFAARIGPDVNDNSKDVVTCSPADSVANGELVNCIVNFAGAQPHFQIFNFSVFYLRTPQPFDVVVISGDNFHRTPDVPRDNVLDYQSRMKPLE